MLRVDDDRVVTSPEWVGSSILFWGKKNSRFPYQCFVGPDWPVVILTYILIIGANLIVLGITSPLGWIPGTIGAFTCCILLYYYTFTIGTNPGYIYKDMPKTIALSPTVSIDHTTTKDIESLAGNTSNNSMSPLLEAVDVPVDPSITSSSDVAVHEGDQLLDSSIKNIHINEKLLPGGISDIENNQNDQNNTNGIKVVSHNTNPNPNTASVSPQIIGIPPVSATNTSTAIPSGIECGQCQLQRPYAARHCYYCDACVEELDHHCPWCGKCIGENNVDGFHCFVGWLNFQFYYLMGLFLYYLITEHSL